MRYDLDFKIKVIAYYREGHSGYATSKQFNLDTKIISRWVNQYQRGGLDAIKPKTHKAKYTSEFKLHVLTTMADEGLSQSQAALRFTITSPALLSVWRSSYDRHGMLGLTTKAKGRPSVKPSHLTDKPDDQKSLAELKRENEYLRAENAYLKKLDALLKAEEQDVKKQGSSKD